MPHLITLPCILVTLTFPLTFFVFLPIPFDIFLQNISHENRTNHIEYQKIKKQEWDENLLIVSNHTMLKISLTLKFSEVYITKFTDIPTKHFFKYQLKIKHHHHKMFRLSHFGNKSANSAVSTYSGCNDPICVPCLTEIHQPCLKLMLLINAINIAKFSNAWLQFFI